MLHSIKAIISYKLSLSPTNKLSACRENASFIGLSRFVTFYFRFFARFSMKNCGFDFDGSVFSLIVKSMKLWTAQQRFNSNLFDN